MVQQKIIYQIEKLKEQSFNNTIFYAELKLLIKVQNHILYMKLESWNKDTIIYPSTWGFPHSETY